MEKQKKVIIFDFDGTLYSSEHKYDLLKPQVDENRRKFLPYLTDEQYKNLCQESPEWEQAVGSNKIAKTIYDMKYKYPEYLITVDAFLQWQYDEVYNIVLDKSQFVNTEFLKQVCEKYPTYVVSNSSFTHIKFYMDKIGVSPEWFKYIFSNSYLEYDQSKKPYYKTILDFEKGNPKDYYVFGDSKSADLEPASELGMSTILVKNAKDIQKQFEESVENSVENSKEREM